MLSKRYLAFVLCMLLIGSLLSSACFAAAKKQDADAVFDAIDKAIGEAQVSRIAMTDAEKTLVAKQAVQKLGYETTDRGDGCFIFTANGEPCIFNSRMYRIFSEMTPLEGYVDDGQVVTVDYSSGTTGPDSKDVYLIEPFYGQDSSFTKQYQNEASSIAKATGGTYTLYKTSKATIDAVADALEAGGVVIFDSHGDTDYYETPDRGDYVSKANTSYLLLSTGTGLTAADKSSATGEFGIYHHAMSSYGYYYVDGTAITNHMEKSAPDSLVWMAICLGMATDGMEKPLREHGAGVVYGYSQSVTFDGDYDYEETFWDKMIEGADVKTAIAAMKSKHGNWDPGMGCSSISSARREYAAFPIVVSDQDPYPGHGNVDDYQTVNSEWGLLSSAPSYQIQAVSGNEAHGTVVLSGQTVTAYPKEGYAVEDCTVTPAGACTVTKQGDSFLLSDIVSDCTVTVTFCARKPVSVTYQVPDGVSCAPTDAYAGDIVNLAAPEGQPSADRYDYLFLGWTSAPVKATETLPEYYPAGTEWTLTENIELYALYSYDAFAEDGSDGASKLTKEAEDLSGNYVIGFDSSVFLSADGTVTGTAIGGKSGAVTSEASGTVCVGDKLYLVPDTMKYEFSLYDADAKTYTIRMKNSKNYLLHTLIGNALSTTEDPTTAGTQWKFLFEGETVRIKNVSTGKYLQYNAKSAIFRCYADGTYAPVTLYSCGQSDLRYTTEPEAACAHIWSEEETVAAPTCLLPGISQSVCTLCGKVNAQSVPAIGHDYQQSVIDPTCTDAGYTVHTCSRCQDSYRDEPVEALGHDYADGFCTRCGETDPNYVPPIDPCEGYTDVVADDWYYLYVRFVVAKGLMGSVRQDSLTFSPDSVCTRGMVVTILYSLAGKPEITYQSNPFKDVKAGQWYTQPIIWAYETGIAGGYGDGTFGANDRITREQLAVMFKAYAEKVENRDTTARADLSDFADCGKVTWSKDAMAWAVAAKLISGKPGADGTKLLDPQGNATRAEIAVILTKFSDR